jgi:hypothetical protein
MAGRMLGVALGEYFVGRCLQGHSMKTRSFLDQIVNQDPADFNPFSADQDLNTGKFYSIATTATAIQDSPLMGAFWTAARNEWKPRFP